MGKTHEEHVRRVNFMHEGMVIVDGVYTHSLTKVRYRCPDHGTWYELPGNIEAGGWCSICSTETRLAKMEIKHKERVLDKHGDKIIPIDIYRGARRKLRYKCPKHGIFKAVPHNVMNGSGCRLCYNKRVSERTRKTHKVYKEEVSRLGFVAIGTYEGAHFPIMHKCSKGHLWKSKPNQVLCGYGCPRCDNSQYRRRPVTVGDRVVLVQGSEGKAVSILLDEGVNPDDIIFSTKNGLPTFRYNFDGKSRTYVPDFHLISINQIVEVKSVVTLGVYDEDLYRQVQAKARAVLRSKYDFRLLVVHRGRHLNLGRGWHRLSWPSLVERVKKKTNDKDLRFRRQ